MTGKNEILKQASAALKLHSRELTALRKVSARKLKQPYKLTVDFPHFTYFLKGKLEKRKVGVINKGLRVILFENKKPVGTMDFTFEKKKLRLSHFTFGKKSNHLFKQIKRIYKKYMLPEDSFLEVVKATALGKSAIRFPVGNTLKYVDLDTDKKDRVEAVDEVDFIKNYNVQRREILRAEKKFKAKKSKVNDRKIDRLRFLNYL